MVSCTIALMPPTLAMSFNVFLISVIAFNVFSFDVVSLNVTNIRVLSPFFTCSRKLSGNISKGIDTPVRSLIVNTLLTPSIFLIFFSASRTFF